MEEITAEHDVSLVRRLFTISVRCVNDKVLITGCWKICGPLFQFKKLEIYKIPSSVCIMTALVSLLTDRLVFGLLALLITTLKQLFFFFFSFLQKWSESWCGRYYWASERTTNCLFKNSAACCGVFCKRLLQFDVCKNGIGLTTDWEGCGMLQKHLFGTFHR